MQEDQREHSRINANLTVFVTTTDKQEIKMTTLDISTGGLRLLSKEKFLTIEPGESIAIHIPSQTDCQATSFIGEIRHYSYEPNGDGVFGINITSIDDSNKHIWHQAITKLSI